MPLDFNGTTYYAERDKKETQMPEWTGTCSQAPCNKSEQSQAGQPKYKDYPKPLDYSKGSGYVAGVQVSQPPEMLEPETFGCVDPNPRNRRGHERISDKMMDTIATPDKNTPE